MNAHSNDYWSRQHWDEVFLNTDCDAALGAAALLHSVVGAACNLLHDPRGKRTLDVGSGDSDLSAILAAQGADSLSVDFSSIALAKARNRHQKSGSSYVAMDVHRLALRSEVFHLATCVRSIWTFQHFATVLQEVYRILRPGGSLLLHAWSAPKNCLLFTLGSTVVARHITGWDPPGDYLGPFYFSAVLLKKELEAAGFLNFRIAQHRIEIQVPTMSVYWKEFAAIAGSAYRLISSQPRSVLENIENEVERLLQKEREHRGHDGLPLEWNLYEVEK